MKAQRVKEGGKQAGVAQPQGKVAAPSCLGGPPEQVHQVGIVGGAVAGGREPLDPDLQDFLRLVLGGAEDQALVGIVASDRARGQVQARDRRGEVGTQADLLAGGCRTKSRERRASPARSSTRDRGCNTGGWTQMAPVSRKGARRASRRSAGKGGSWITARLRECAARRRPSGPGGPSAGQVDLPARRRCR